MVQRLHPHRQGAAWTVNEVVIVAIFEKSMSGQMFGCPHTILASSHSHWGCITLVYSTYFSQAAEAFCLLAGEISFVLLVASGHAIVMVELEVVLSAG